MNPTVADLWSQLALMEAETPYPEGMALFPFRLTGQGFFPGGDGLWREHGHLDQSSAGVLPLGGIMIVGNDFGWIETYRTLREKRYESVPKWRHLKRRIRLAGLPTSLIFATNAVLGLRIVERARDKKDWSLMPKHLEFCREFFLFEIATMKPRLIVVLGPAARRNVKAWLGICTGGAMSIGDARPRIHFSTHPDPDNRFEKRMPERVPKIAAKLAEEWLLASGNCPSEVTR